MYFLFRAVLKLAIYKRWSQKWWRQRINMSSVYDTLALERKPSTGALLLWFMHWTVEKEQLASRPDVKRWNESWSTQEIVKEKRPTFEDARSVRSSCRCAFITPSYAVKVSVKYLFVGSWNASFKLLMNTKLISRTCRGKSYNYIFLYFHYKCLFF